MCSLLFCHEMYVLFCVSVCLIKGGWKMDIIPKSSYVLGIGCLDWVLFLSVSGISPSLDDSVFQHTTSLSFLQGPLGLGCPPVAEKASLIIRRK